MIKFFKRSKSRRGFTFIELLVVLTIIGVLAAAGAVTYGGANKKARDGKRKADLEQLRSALEMYRSDYDNYPPGDSFDTMVAALQTGGFVNQDFSDPSSYTYFYNRTSDRSYLLCAHLETESGTTICGSNCSGECNYIVQNP